MASTSIRVNRTGMIVIAAGLAFIFMYTMGFPFWRRLYEQKVSMKEVLSVSIDLARKGGERVRIIREDPSGIKGRVKGKTKEGADEMLTTADLESHRIMHGGFSKAFPHLKIISEEHDNEEVHSDIPDTERSISDVASLASSEHIFMSDITVWIDPLDATQEFTENLTEYVTTMVCVAVNGKPVIGVVHQPFTQETFWAYVGHGSSQNLKSTAHGKKKELKRVVVSRSHAGDVKDFVGSTESFGQKVDIVSAGGAGYKVLQVLLGKAEAYVHVTAIKKWDICAGNALTLAANGEMTTLRNRTVDYSTAGSVVSLDGLLVSNRLSRQQRDTFLGEFSTWKIKRKQKSKA